MSWTEVAAVVVSVVAVGVSAWSLRHARASAEAARRAADASERSADAAERQATAAEAALPPPPPLVDWRIGHGKGKDNYVLRNIGTETASSVEINDTNYLVQPIDSPALTAAELAPGESIAFHVFESHQTSIINEVKVRWRGSDGWRTVPLP